MTLHEEIDLNTGSHLWMLHISAREIVLISELGRTLPAALTASPKLSDKFVILSMVCQAIERQEEAKQSMDDIGDV